MKNLGGFPVIKRIKLINHKKYLDSQSDFVHKQKKFIFTLIFSHHPSSETRLLYAVT